jgi:hypothetical protein
LITGVADETNLRCADTVIDARFSCDLCSLVGLLLLERSSLLNFVLSILTLVAGVYRRNRAPLRKEKRAWKAAYFRQTSQLYNLGQEGGSGELLLQ